ncbi:NUDIX hydrolase [Shimia ponticola]|uniref:NUDIX hydrolase n=1 Tax=Shimia ponticola TaxID=2582893 RepID=UPI0011BE4B23|nr:NUDIX domain-containing protein [Shimia ponticola]
MHDHPLPILTVDVVLLSLRDGALQVGLTRRDKDPFQGEWALPGGYIHTDTDADTTATARRVARDKAGLQDVYCEQLATISGPERDPRGWSATVVHYALVRGAVPKDSPLKWRPAAAPGPLAFDHNGLIAATLERLRGKGAYSNLPAFFLPAAFTLSELRSTYEQVLGQPLNDAAFRRKIEESGFVTPLPGQLSKATARPAQLYELTDTSLKFSHRRI